MEVIADKVGDVTEEPVKPEVEEDKKARKISQFCSWCRLTGGCRRIRLAASLCKNKIVLVQVFNKKETEKMAAYAIAYGFTLYSRKSIRNHEEDYTWIEDNWYMSNGDYAQFEEIMEKEF